jgi:chromate transport protein ChrA
MLTAALLLARLLPAALQPGMFFDGVIHATIARNMAIGDGDFWHPVLFGPGCDYHEQPTLAFWLESLLFRVFGDHFWVEKLYSTILAVATAAVIAAIWRLLLRDRPALRDCSWLPVALWACLPGWAWMYDSNMLENTLGLFALGSVYASLRAAISPRAWLAWTAAAAICLAGAVLAKGPVGMYPLITPLVIPLAIRGADKQRMVLVAEGLVLIFLLSIGLLLMQRGAHEYLVTYLHDQVVSSLTGQREIVHSRLGRLDILWRMLGQLLVPALAAAGLIAWAGVRRRGSVGSVVASGDAGEIATPKAESLFCLFTAFSASLPIAISPKQSGHYAFPSYSLYALAFAMWCAPAVLELFGAAAIRGESRMRLARGHRLPRGFAVAGSACVLICTCFLAGRPHRDKDVYHDTLVVGRLVPRQSTIGITADLGEDYPIQVYLARCDAIAPQHGLSTGGRNASSPQYCLAALGAESPPGYRPVAADLLRYRLFERLTSAADRVGLGDHLSRR